MRKHCAYSEALNEEFRRYKQEVCSGRNKGFGLLMDKLVAALDSNAFDNENVIKWVATYYYANFWLMMMAEVLYYCRNLSVRSTKRKQNKDHRRKQREEGIYYPSKNQHIDWYYVIYLRRVIL